MRRVLSQYGILISDSEFNALVTRYADENGFNYVWFLKEVDPQEYLIYAPKVAIEVFSIFSFFLFSNKFKFSFALV